MFSHILIATDFSDPAKRAAISGHALAKAFAAKVTILHVIDSDDTDEMRENVHDLLAKLRDEVFAEQAGTVALEVSEHVRADVAICQQARTLGVDLIVTGRHGDQTMGERLLGSTTERVARHAHCSLLVTHGNEGKPQQIAARVLACSDLSPQSERAIEEAGELAKRFGGKLTLAHVYTIDAPPFAYDADEPRRNADMERLAEDALSKLRADKLGDLAVAYAVREHDSAVAGICELAEELDTDLISLGTHGRTGLTRLLIGSVAERVIRHAPCSVLVARR